MTTYIYALRCPESGDIRYIGKSVNPQKRLSAHISAAMNHAYRHHTSNWIRKLSGSNLAPSVEILEKIPVGQSWREVERRWIREGRDKGWPLTNSTSGGEGLDYLREEDRNAYLANLKSSLERYRNTAKGREHFLRFKAASRTPEVNERRAESIRESSKNPDYIEKMKSVNLEIGSRPEVKLKRSAKAMENWSDPSVRKKRMEAFSSPEVKGIQSEKRKAAWADPVLGAKLREIHNSPEVRARKSKSAKNRATPEYRAMMAEKTRLAWAARRKTELKEL